jgi:GntP family gluconate:H+ symporter
MPATQIIATVKDGFGHIMRSLGLIIVLGTTLGIILEHTGSTKVMASFILKKVGERNAPFAMSITGFIVGLPIFCDSGYIVLNGLNQSMARKTGISVVVMSVALSTGLYSVHCLLPPHPGATAAAATIGADFGKLILMGIVVAIPAMLVGYWWARFAGKEFEGTPDGGEDTGTTAHESSVLKAFLPVIFPIILIAVSSFMVMETKEVTGWGKILSVLGDPVIALSIGVLLALVDAGKWKREVLGKLLTEAAEKAGAILVIIGAGGSFGAVLAATKLGQHFGAAVPLESLGILFPFLLTFVIKTAQGSSTVAIVTASAIVLPLLPALGLNTNTGKILCVLAMGSGSMMISHANDAYFWVIAKFSGIEMRPMLKVYTVSSILMGLVSLGMVYIISFLIS